MGLCAYKRHINHTISEEIPMSRPIILNDYTSAEIEAARAKLGSKRAERPCLWCEKVVSMRGDQHFCSAPCRASYARAAAQIEVERRAVEKQHWLAERDELIKEIQRLRRAVGEPDFTPRPPRE
jgi:hypothetical protein